MITNPFISLSSQLNILIEEHQKFAKDLFKKRKIFYEKDNSNETFSSFVQELQTKVLTWFSNLNLEEKIKVCTFQNKWLIQILIQIYLLYENNNKIKFKPSNEMKIFFNELNSLNSFKLLYNNISPNDEIKSSNEKEEKEIKSNEKKIEIEEENLYFYKTYFISNKIKDDKNEDKQNFEKEILKSIKIISLNDIDNEFDTITFSSDLLSDQKKFKRCFKFFSNDNYFKDLIKIFKDKNGVLNFKMPTWMKINSCFSFCQILFGFLEQNILLNYEYFYYTNQLYDELTYFKKIQKIYEENQNIENILNNKSKYFEQIFSESIIKSIIEIIKTKKKFLKINEKLRNICNKVYFDNFNYPLFDRNILYKDVLNISIYKELKSFIEDNKNEKQKCKKLIDKLSFLNFNEVINSRQFIYLLYRKKIINYFTNIETDKLKQLENNKKNEELKEEKNINKNNISIENKLEDNNKINNINKINTLYSQKEDSDDKLVRIISNSSITTKNESEHLSVYSDDSLSINSDISPMIDKDKIKNKNIINNTLLPNNNYINNNMNINFINNIFSTYCYSYYDKAINNYLLITKTNLTILNNLKEQKLKIIENIIINNLKDKFDLMFGYYGSHFTGLSIEGSEIDICLVYKQKNNINLNFCEELYKLLLKQKPLIYNIIYIFNTEIPLLKIEIDITDEIKKMPLKNLYGYIDYEDINKIKIDINISDNKEYLELSKKNVEYVKKQIEIYHQIKPILLILKRYFKKMKMNKVFHGGISSYSLFLLILNVIKSELKGNPNAQIGNSQLLFLTLKKFSFFNFGYKGIGIDNYDYVLGIDNFEENLYIISPLTGKNVAKGRCKGEKLKKAFSNAYYLLACEINYFRNFFNIGFNPFNKPPINSIVALFNSNIKFFN